MHTTRLLTVSPSMHCAGGGLPCQGCLARWGGCLLARESALPGVSVLPGGSALPGGLPCQGVLPCQGKGIPACTEADPPMNRIKDACENITSLVQKGRKPRWSEWTVHADKWAKSSIYQNQELKNTFHRIILWWNPASMPGPATYGWMRSDPTVLHVHLQFHRTSHLSTAEQLHTHLRNEPLLTGGLVHRSMHRSVAFNLWHITV